MKKRSTYLLDVNTIERLERYAKVAMVKKSPLVNKAINDYLDEQKFEVEKDK